MNREIKFHLNYFIDFYKALDDKTKHKVNEVLKFISEVEKISSKFLKKIEGVDGLFEIRVKYTSNIYRIFCIFDEGKIVILLNAFQKKTQKTPANEIKKAEKLMKEYFESRK